MIFPIIILGLILRTISLDQSLWLDEAINVLATQKFSLLGMITEYAKADFHPPGWFIILWFWTKLFDYSEVAIRVPSVIFGLMTIWITYLIGKKLFSQNLRLIAAILLAVNPLHIYYSQEARMYSLAALVVSVNILFLVKLIKGEKLNLFYLILSDLTVLASDYISYFIFPTQLTLLVFLKKREMIKKWMIALVSAVILGIWWLPIFLSQLNVGSIASANLPTWKLVVGSFDFKALPLTFVKFIIGRISLADKFVYGAILLPIGSLFAFLLYKSLKVTDNLSRNLLISWITIPTVIALLISLFVPVYSYFRLLFILPAFLMLIAFGILSFKSRAQYFFLIMVILVEFSSSLVYLLNPAYQREDWRGLVNYLKSANNNALILFESSGTWPPFDYYAQGNLNAKGALKDFPAKEENDLVDFKSFPASKDIYLVDYLVEVTDPQRLVKEKIGKFRYKLSETKDFTGVGFVYHYVRE